MDVEKYRLDKEANDATLDYMSALAEYTAKQQEQFRLISGSLFDAITSGKNKEIENYFQVIGKDIGKTIFENLAQLGEKQITSMIPHANGGILAQILKGTPMGPDQLKVSTDANTAVTINNTNALMRITGSGGVAGPSGLPSVGGSSVAGSVAGIGGSPLGGGILAMGNGLPAAGIDVGGSPLGGGILSMSANLPSASVSALSTTAGLVTAATAAAGGIFSAVKLFDGSGASGLAGKLTDTAGIAASVGAILPLISSSLSLAGPIGMAVGAALPLIASLFPSGPASRANQIWKETIQNTYQAPTALNETMTTNGNYSSINYRGGLTQTGFSARPQVTDPYLYWGPHNTPVEAPGNVLSPFSPQTTPTVVQHIYQAGAIQTMDSASFNDFAQANHTAIGDAAARNMQSGPSRLTTVVRYNTVGR